MTERLKSIKLNVTLSAVLTVLLGLVMIFYPEQTNLFVARFIAAIIVVVGALQLIHALFGEGNRSRTSGMVVAAIILVLGLYLFFRPALIVNIIPIIIGILLVVHGVQDFSMAFETRGYEGDRWWIGLVLGLISIVAGLFCIANAFKVVAFGVMLTGIMLVYDGVTDMLVVHKVNAAHRTVDSKILREEDIEDFE